MSAKSARNHYLSVKLACELTGTCAGTVIVLLVSERCPSSARARIGCESLEELRGL